MSFLDDVKAEEACPSMNATSVWLDGQDDATRDAFYRWLREGRSRAALFRAARKNGLDNLSSISSFREHCREILEGLNAESNH